MKLTKSKLKEMVKEEIQRLDEGFTSSQIKKAIDIAKQMSGNMTGAAKKIEKLKKGLSQDSEVKDALKTANESVNEAKKKVDISKLSVGNTYKDSKGYPVKIVDISGGGNTWKITYKDGHGNKKTIKTSLSKGVNLYESINEGNPTPSIQKKLIKIFQNDPLYKDVIMATNSKQMQKAIVALKSIRGPNAIELLKKHSKKLMGSEY